MNKIELIRIDFRMIHGQVMVKWIKTIGTKTIYAVNDEIANDPFLQDVYMMSAPKDIEIKVFNKDAVIEHINSPKCKDTKVLVLFKNVADAYYCYKNGFNMEAIQIGGLGAGPDRINVCGPITLNKIDAKLLKEMDDSGVDVYFQQIPDESKVSLNKIFKKYNIGI